MLKMKNNYRIYLELWDAFQTGGCPICALVEKQNQRDIEVIINTHDQSAEKDIVNNDAILLCSRHIQEIFASGSLATTIRIMEDTLKRREVKLKEIFHNYEESSLRLFFLQKIQWNKSFSHSLVRWTQNCHICQNITQRERQYLEAFLDNLTDLDFAAEFKRSGGVCFLHIVKALAMFPYHRNLLSFIRVQIEKIQIHRMELSERKYHFRQQADKGREIDFFKRMLEIISGKHEVFLEQVDQGKSPFETSDNHSFLPSFQGESTAKEENEDMQIVIEKLTFENEKLRRQNENLRNDYKEEAARAASLHHNYWMSHEDNKKLKINLVGAQAKAEGYSIHIERLNKEIEKLQETFKNNKIKDVTNMS